MVVRSEEVVRVRLEVDVVVESEVRAVTAVAVAWREKMAMLVV